MKKILLFICSFLLISTLSFSATKAFSEKELSKYNGKNGNKAYIAVDGDVYDVTNSPLWKNGNHNGISAGKDLSKEINRSPHGKSVLKRLNKVGVLLKEFTLNELSKYNGKNGNKAYIAVDGKVYDVTNSPLWKNGNHNGISAGKDLSKEINRSPHGKSVLKRLDQVGTLKENKK